MMNSAVTKIAAVVVVLVIIAAACAVFLLNDDNSDNSGVELPGLPVFGNADEDVDIDQADLDIIQNIIDGADGYTLSDYPMADANNDGTIDDADVDIVTKVINNESTEVYHYIYTNDGGSNVNTSVVSTSWPNSSVMVSYCSVMFLSEALGIEDKVVGSTEIIESTYVPGAYYYDQVLFADIADHATPINSSSEESWLSCMRETGATLIVCSGYDTNISDSMMEALEADGCDVVRLCESVPIIEPTVASVLLYGFLIGAEETAQDLAEFYQQTWDRTLEIADSIPSDERILAACNLGGPDNAHVVRTLMAGADYAFENCGQSLNAYGSYDFGDWVYSQTIDCMVVPIWANSLNGSYFGDLNAEYILESGISADFKTLDVYKNGGVYIINGDAPTAMDILIRGYAMYPEYYGDLYDSAMETMLSFLGDEYSADDIDWVYSTADLERMANGGDSDDSFQSVTDAMGNQVQFDAVPERIVTTTVTAAEMLSDLGFRSNIVGATADPGIYDVSSDIIGIDLTFDYPASIQADIDSGKIINVGEFYTWTAETVAAANPTLVVMESNQLETDASRMTQLQSLGITVLVLWSDDGIDTIQRNYELLGDALAASSRASEINAAIDDLDSRIMDAVSTGSDLKVAHICYCYGSYYIYDSSSTMQVMEDLGFQIGLRADTSFTTITPEDIAAADLDLIIFDDMSTGLDWEEVIADWKADPVMGSIDAIANDNIYCMEYDPFQATSYSTVHFMEGKALIASILMGDQLGVDVPNIITDEHWRDYIQWLDA